MNIKQLCANIRYLFDDTFEVFVTSIPLERTSIIGLITAKILKKNTVLWEVGWKYHNMRRYRWKIAVFFYKHFLIHLIDSYFIPSTKTLNFLGLLKIKREEIFLQPQCSIDISRIKEYSDTITGELLGFLWPEKKVVLYLSRVIRLKGLDILIKAFSKLQQEKKDYFLLIAGDGEHRPFCQKLAQELTLKNYKFLGAVEDDRLKATLYKKSDVFVLPTRFYKDRSEAWGLVVNEALSCSLPVVVTNAVGCSEDLVINGKNGFIIPHSNPEAMAGAIAQILTKDDLRDSMKLASRQIYEEKNDFQKMADEFIKAVEYATKN